MKTNLETKSVDEHEYTDFYCITGCHPNQCIYRLSPLENSELCCELDSIPIHMSLGDLIVLRKKTFQLQDNHDSVMSMYDQMFEEIIKKIIEKRKDKDIPRR